MKKYETPELNVETIETADVIAMTVDESGENVGSWLNGWASGLSKLQG